MISHPFTARYDGWCPACRSTITAGDVIVTTDGGSVHVYCRFVELDDPLTIGSRETVCDSCHLIHQGECF